MFEIKADRERILIFQILSKYLKSKFSTRQIIYSIHFSFEGHVGSQKHAILTWGLGVWGCCTWGWLIGSSFFLLPARSHSWSFFITRGESVRRNIPDRGPRAASSVSRTRSRRPDGSCGAVDVNLTVDLESPSESSPSRCRINRLLYLDLFLGTSYSGASYLAHNNDIDQLDCRRETDSL